MRRIIIGAFCVLFTVLLINIHFIRLAGLNNQMLALGAERQGLTNKMLYHSLIGLKENPYNINLNGYAGAALIKLKKYSLALGHLNLFLKYYPNNINALLNEAFIYRETRDIKGYSESVNKIVKIISIDPNYEKVRLVRSVQ